jgi:phage I-like protein
MTARPVRMLAAIDVIANDERLVERAATGAAPSAFRIWKAGDNPTDKGSTIFSARSATLLASAEQARGNLVSIDVDHLSLSQTAPPESRKAVGWHRLEVRTDERGAQELWAVDVQWTDVAKVGLEKEPPEWRYFSPAYDVDPETREVVAYLNTALTNNPATWQVTALASRAATEESSMDPKKEDVLAALKAIAEGDDEEASTWAKKMIRAAEGDEPEPEKKPDGNGDGGEKKDAAEEPKEKDGGDDDKKDTVTTTATVVELAATVQRLATEVTSLKRDKIEDERTRLLASRPDFTPELVGVLKKAPIATLRDAVKSIPVAAKKDPAAAVTVAATRGTGQGASSGADRTARLPPKEKQELDDRMGLGARRDSIRREGSAVVFGVMSREEAQRAMQAKGEGK